MIDASTCNATDQAGCADLETLQVPNGNGDDLAVDASTDTVYVSTETDTGPDFLSVFNGATCNANSTGGCSQVPVTLKVGDSGGAFNNSQLNIAVNQLTNTIYATNIAGFNTGNLVDKGVYVINGAICDAADTSGCGTQAPELITSGLSTASALTPSHGGSQSTRSRTPSTSPSRQMGTTPATCWSSMVPFAMAQTSLAATRHPQRLPSVSTRWA